MDESIRLQLYFNEKTEWENQTFFFRYTWQKHLAETKKAALYTVLFLIVGFVPLKAIDLGPVSVIFRYGAFIFVGYTSLLLYQYFGSKKKTYNLTKKHIDDFKKKKDEISDIALHPDSITVKTPFTTIECIWEKTNYKLVDKYLILTMLDKRIKFIFTKPEFKENEYKTLLDFIQQYSHKEK
ncbi:MAG: hypothetical protein MUW56_07605 [Chryseobacterium sp.]|uniref:hypothetical protein n=1 Tax=Chryseobacterium sp. TaxID=1871047 RepID=UPI0025BE97E2|nr:hypothetical protein [Chryseobacterium sp.]MCJ7933492.1 hypothetical protein [Chryseobacterium sp.]